jgi:phosphopantothenoylcysteine decarboxylase/phosphopantothenate--cysteine ligase
VEFVPVTSAQEMADAVFARYDNVDVVIMSAAVCDFRPKIVAGTKIKKGAFTGTLELEATMDILAELGKRKRSQLLVGFAAETDNVERNARDKLQRKRLDLIVANDASAFESEMNAVTLMGRDGRCEKLPEMPKADAARAIVERVIRLLA